MRYVTKIILVLACIDVRKHRVWTLRSRMGQTKFKEENTQRSLDEYIELNMLNIPIAWPQSINMSQQISLRRR